MSIFDEKLSRKPNFYPWTKDFIDAMHNGHWSSTEFSFSHDKHQYKTELSFDEQEIIKKSLTAIGTIELPVKSFWANLGRNIKRPEFIDLGFVFANVEVIHSDAYSKLIDVLQLEEEFEKILEVPVIKNRMAYLKKYSEKIFNNDKQQFLYSLILFTLYTENVSLFSQFYIINWFNKFKRFGKDLPNQTAYTAREENLHAEAGIKIIRTIRKEYPEFFDEVLTKKILHEAEEALKAEEKIIDWIIGNYSGEALSSEILKNYIRNRFNKSLKDIGFTELFQVNKEQLELTRWMDEEVLGGVMTDFFKSRPTEYSKKSQVIDGESIF
jgi:ribonucleoside-diphosphate reductase beta chain